MRAGAFLAAAALAGALSAAADEPRLTVNTYRSAFLAQCEERAVDQLAACTCGFDEWSRSLPDPSAGDAMAAARVMSGQVKSARDYEVSVTAMSGLTVAMINCASSDRYGELDNADEMIDLVKKGSEPIDSGAVNFTGMLGSADAEVPPPARQGSAVILDENGDEVRFEPVEVVDLKVAYSNDHLSLIEDEGVLETPLLNYHSAFLYRCTRGDELEQDACECAWEGLVAAADGADGAKERMAAYIAVSTNIDYEAYDPALLSESMEVIAIYSANRQACFPIPDVSVPEE
ncbi:hypothetical protein HY29_17005 [Hyphomonas beringensis]|uniref:Uncharacterized protein n=1 Tax=Hyphomonas beringensis TaxID=1280946 RepID=A0A062U751_9PROT|nr:hypothetical protein [Hyphomonas beringensis]KCZ53568.1 hypothetical protein HY29_17005 [Hyphomonas beringensis]